MKARISDILADLDYVTAYLDGRDGVPGPIGAFVGNPLTTEAEQLAIVNMRLARATAECEGLTCDTFTDAIAALNARLAA